MVRPITIVRTAALAAVLLAAACGKDPEVAKREFVKSGDAYVAQKKYSEAVIQYRNAVQADARFGEARKKLADAYRNTGDLTNAYRESIRAADLLPKDVDAQVSAGQMLLLARQFEDANSRAQKALALDPKNVEALILHANALAGLNKLEDALDEVEAAIREAPDRTTSYTILGAMQMVHGDRKEAEAAFRKAVDADPKSADARLALVNYLWSVGRRSEAGEQLRAILEIDPKNVLANRASALFYIGARQPKQAEPYLKTLAEVLPEGAGKLVLADYYLSLQRRDEARKLLESVVSSGQKSATAAKLRLAGMGLGSGDPAAAMRLIDEILAKEPRNWEALLAKAQTYMRMGKASEAVAAVRSAADVNPDSSDTQFALGRAYVLTGNRQEAMAAFKRALKLNPRMATAEFELAKLYLGSNDLDQAEQFAKAAVLKINGYVEAHLLLARVDLMRGGFSKAEPTIRALAKYVPDLPAVQAELGQLELLKKNRAAARTAFEKALSKNPAQIDAMAGLVMMDIEDKRPEAARAQLEEAARRSPKNGRVLVLAAKSYAVLGDTASTERMARAAVEADANNIEAYALLGGLYIQQRRVDDAIRQFTAVIDKNPRSVSAYTIVGMLLEQKQKGPEARARYEKALALDPHAAVAANNLAGIYMDTGGNLDVALQLAKTAKAGLPDRPEVSDTLGWAFYKKGQYSQAVPSLLDSVTKEPRNPTYHYHLGLAYAALSETGKARDALQKSLALQNSGANADAARRALADLKS